MTILERFPEIYRNWCAEMTKARILAGFLTVNAICFSIFLVAYKTNSTGAGILHLLLFFEGGLLLIYGTQRTALSIGKEKIDRTWDFQRLTPLSSYEIVLGKLIGAPIHAYFLTLAFIPWTIGTFLFKDPMSTTDFLFEQGILFSLAFLVLNIGLLGSSSTDTGRNNALGAGGAVIGGFAFIVLFNLNPQRAIHFEWSVPFYGWLIPSRPFLIASAMVFGAWAFAGTKWRIGKDLLEGGRYWRLPLFLIFLSAYLFGIGNWQREPRLKDFVFLMALYAPITVVYIGALINREGIDYWRQWFLVPGDRLNRVPVWMSGLVTMVLIAIWISSVSSDKNIDLIAMTISFLARDLVFLQWCRFTKSRRPEAMAAVYLGVIYILPTIVLSALKLESFIYIFSPIPNDRISILQNLSPALAQLVLVVFATYSGLKPHLEKISS